jgi:hypothetical protein
MQRIQASSPCVQSDNRYHFIYMAVALVRETAALLSSIPTAEVPARVAWGSKLLLQQSWCHAVRTAACQLGVQALFRRDEWQKFSGDEVLENFEIESTRKTQGFQCSGGSSSRGREALQSLVGDGAQPTSFGT